MTTPKPRTRRRPRDDSYLVATFVGFPGVEIPLLSDAECKVRGITKPTISLLGHLTPEERLKRLEPLIALLAEQIVRELLDEARRGPESPEAF